MRNPDDSHRNIRIDRRSFLSVAGLGITGVSAAAALAGVFSTPHLRNRADERI